MKDSPIWKKGERIKDFGKKNSCSNNPLPLSVIICTFNRAGLLKMALESLVKQTLSKADYEVIIIDDGSSDSTKETVDSFFERLPIKYFYQNNAGLASAKKHGIYAAQGKILLFGDDDDIAMPNLLEEHVKTHREYPEDNYAVLHYTTWSPNLLITPLMHFVVEVGCFLFSYPHIKHGDILDYTYFWGGRSSCKRSFLINYGVFNPVFHFGCEDIELGYRLSKKGLKVVYNGLAVAKMVRPITFDGFCQRLIKQGRSQYIFSTLHNEPEVHRWAEVMGVEEKWINIRAIYEAKIRSARELDRIVNMKLKHHLDLDDLTMRLLYRAYWWTFKSCKIRGIVEAKEESQQKASANQYEKSPKNSL
ncbi:MAG: glycosyltransferase family 2 protein [Deltaproteobacteria bacterium]|nr:glycosyltransferase family 2 protein [Deltaproteobacteria bacterium]